MVYPRKSNDSSGRRQSRVFASLTVSFSFDIIPCITAIASSAVPRQQITSRVARGNFTPQALTEPDVRLSPHPALITRPMVALPREVPPHRWVDPATKLGDWAPSLHAHYRHFFATTSPSAPVPRIGTLALVALPLGLLPSHRGDRFPG